MNKISNQTIVIIVLGALLLFSLFMRGGVFDTQYKKDVLELKKDNIRLSIKNDSLIRENKNLDIKIIEIVKDLGVKKTKIDETQVQINKLKSKRYEIPTYVNNLSGDGIADEFTKYLENR